MGDTDDSLDFKETVEDDWAIFIPAGKWHNIINLGDVDLKLYSVYSPLEHPHGTVHATAEDAARDEHHH
jgi:mannose-6-phosphate isomerase-like protein (cupin superfamily)